MAVKLSDKGLLEIAEHEGFVPAPYRDSVGIWTFGIGHTKAAGGVNPEKMPRGMPVDLDTAIDQAIEIFRQDVVKYEVRVNEAIKVELEQHQFDALVSFDFNTGGIHRAQLTKSINFGDPDASRHFFGWLKPREVRGRRTAEKHLFETGDYDANGHAIAIWRVGSDGRLRGALKTISGEELLERMGRLTPTQSATVQVEERADAQQLRREIMTGKKGFFSSKSVWGGLISAAGGLSFAGYSLSVEDASSIWPLLQGIGTAIAGLLSIYGRVKATKSIG